MAEVKGLRFGGAIEQALDEQIGISPKLLDSLENDDDWTFVIKVHGILEAGLNHLLITQFGDPAASKIVSFLPTNDLRTGKLAFIKAYKLLSESGCLFVRVVSEVRNRAVHDVKNFDLNLVNYVRDLDVNQRDNWKIAMTSWCKEDITEGLKNVTATHPRQAIQSSCMWIMFECLVKRRQAESWKRQMSQLAKEYLERHAPEESNPKE